MIKNICHKTSKEMCIFINYIPQNTISKITKDLEDDNQFEMKNTIESNGKNRKEDCNTKAETHPLITLLASCCPFVDDVTIEG